MIIEKAINTVIDEPDHPLLALLKSGHASEKWLMLYFDMLKKCQMTVNQDILNKAMDSMDNIIRLHDSRSYTHDKQVEAQFQKEKQILSQKCKSILKPHLTRNVN